VPTLGVLWQICKAFASMEPLPPTSDAVWHNWTYVLAFAVAGAVALLVVGAYLGAWLRSYRAVRKMKRGAKLEQSAGALLEKKGYRIVAFQHQARYPIKVDGKEHMIDVRFDFLAKRSGKLYVVEVKSGEKAPDATYAPTRRQLLEYRLVAKTHGVLSLDMETEQIHTVEFPDFVARSGSVACKLSALFLAVIIVLFFLQFSL